MQLYYEGAYFSWNFYVYFIYHLQTLRTQKFFPGTLFVYIDMHMYYEGPKNFLELLNVRGM